VKSVLVAEGYPISEVHRMHHGPSFVKLPMVLVNLNAIVSSPSKTNCFFINPSSAQISHMPPLSEAMRIPPFSKSFRPKKIKSYVPPLTPRGSSPTHRFDVTLISLPFLTTFRLLRLISSIPSPTYLTTPLTHF